MNCSAGESWRGDGSGFCCVGYEGLSGIDKDGIPGIESYGMESMPGGKEGIPVGSLDPRLGIPCVKDPNIPASLGGLPKDASNS